MHNTEEILFGDLNSDLPVKIVTDIGEYEKFVLRALNESF